MDPSSMVAAIDELESKGLAGADWLVRPRRSCFVR
jgi:hypothetical protein